MWKKWPKTWRKPSKISKNCQKCQNMWKKPTKMLKGPVKTGEI